MGLQKALEQGCQSNIWFSGSEKGPSCSLSGL